MSVDVQEMILDEVRGMRADLSSNLSRTAVLEAAVKAGITGNGQPSRLTIVEQNQEKADKRYERDRNRAIGVLSIVTLVGSTCGFFATLLAEPIAHFLHLK